MKKIKFANGSWIAYDDLSDEFAFHGTDDLCMFVVATKKCGGWIEKTWKSESSLKRKVDEKEVKL